VNNGFPFHRPEFFGTLPQEQKQLDECAKFVTFRCLRNSLEFAVIENPASRRVGVAAQITREWRNVIIVSTGKPTCNVADFPKYNIGHPATVMVLDMIE